MKKIDFEIKRELTLETEGRTSTIVLTVGGLQQTAPDQPWGCECFIERVMHRKTQIFGEDGLDALFNALEFCQHSIEGYIRPDRKLWWASKGDLGGIMDFKMSKEDRTKAMLEIAQDRKRRIEEYEASSSLILKSVAEKYAPDSPEYKIVKKAALALSFISSHYYGYEFENLLSSLENDPK